MKDSLEKMTLPCPLDVCDGTGTLTAFDPWDDDRLCPCQDTSDYEPD